MLEINNKVLLLTPEESEDLSGRITTLEGKLFDCSLRLKELSRPSSAPARSDPSDSKGVKLPKLDVPVFNGNILHWTSFWEQFSISVHDCSSLSDAEKFVYLQQALKGGSARSVIDGLAQSGDNYKEAVECLKSRYNRPRLIHKAHVKMILEATPLKDGNGKELRALHDTVQQHVRALKSMGYEPSGPFITSAIELKLDETTMFEWQSHSQKSAGVPHYQDLLDFLNLRAQATESYVSDRVPKRLNKSELKKVPGLIGSHAGDINTRSSSQCSVCNAEKHPLYACPKFKSMSHELKLSTLKSKKLCSNCLGSGHFWHFSSQVQGLSKASSYVTALGSREHLVNSSDGHHHDGPATECHYSKSKSRKPRYSECTKRNLLMTCRVRVKSPNGLHVMARAVLDGASSNSFISERLAQTLCLPRTKQDVVISGVAGLTHESQTHCFTAFNISPVSLSTKVHVTAAIVPQVTCELPTQPVPSDAKWDHLNGLQLADPEFGIPGHIDLLLDVDVYIDVFLTGWRYGQPGTPTAFETHFGWVLAGSVQRNAMVNHFVSCHVALTSSDDILRKFWEIEDSPLSEVGLSPEERSVVQHFEANHKRTSTGRFVVPLPKRNDVRPLGESRSQVVHRFLSLEHTLHAKQQIDQLDEVIRVCTFSDVISQRMSK